MAVDCHPKQRLAGAADEGTVKATRVGFYATTCVPAGSPRPRRSHPDPLQASQHGPLAVASPAETSSVLIWHGQCLNAGMAEIGLSTPIVAPAQRRRLVGISSS